MENKTTTKHIVRKASRSVPPANVRKSVTIPIHGFDGQFYSFDGLVDGKEHIAIVFGDPTQLASLPAPLIRMHSECLTGDVFGSARCDCGEQLKEAVQAIGEEGGVLLYLRQEGRGIGLYPKLDAYALQDQGHDTFEANRLLGLEEDSRDYMVAAQMLKALGVRKVRLLTNNPEKAQQLRDLGVELEQVRPTQVYINRHNRRYLVSKVVKGGHKIDLTGRADRPDEPSRTSRRALSSAEA